MIRFQCPTCQKVLKCPDQGAGRKISCPRCGQRLQVPPPYQVQNRTILGDSLPHSSAVSPTAPSGNKPTSAGMPPGQVPVDCPGCRHSFPVSELGLGRWVNCPKCGMGFAALVEGATTAPGHHSGGGLDENPGFENLGQTGHREHSGLGIASFLIALLVGGLDILLAVAIASGIASSERRATNPWDPKPSVEVKLWSGGVAMYCLNCMSVPLCLVGVGLALVALIAHRDRNHLFSWIGLLGNGVVIMGVLGLYLLRVMVGG